MTPAEKEAQAVQDAYERAIAAVGAQIVTQVMADWEGVNRFTPSGQLLLLSLIRTRVKAYRAGLATLAVRKAQLVQALLKGTQGRNSGDGTKTLGDLRAALTESLRDAGVGRALRAVALDDTTAVRDASYSVEGLVEAVNDGIDKEIETTVAKLGNGRLARIAKKTGVVTPADVDTSRNLVATGAERISLNGARHTDSKIAQLNRDVIGVVRVHNSHAADTPCAFCAMLLSRGPVYTSVGTATSGGDSLDDFHLRCHCTAEPIYNYETYLNSPKYALNRYLHMEWRNNIKGQFVGDEALPAWRQHMKTLSDSRATRVVA